MNKLKVPNQKVPDEFADLLDPDEEDLKTVGIRNCR
jgi:hypothetical protein